MKTNRNSEREEKLEYNCLILSSTCVLICIDINTIMLLVFNLLNFSLCTSFCTTVSSGKIVLYKSLTPFVSAAVGQLYNSLIYYQVQQICFGRSGPSVSESYNKN